MTDLHKAIERRARELGVWSWGYRVKATDATTWRAYGEGRVIVQQLGDGRFDELDSLAACIWLLAVDLEITRHPLATEPINVGPCLQCKGDGYRPSRMVPVQGAHGDVGWAAIDVVDCHDCDGTGNDRRTLARLIVDSSRQAVCATCGGFETFLNIHLRAVECQDCDQGPGFFDPAARAALAQHADKMQADGHPLGELIALWMATGEDGRTMLRAEHVLSPPTSWVHMNETDETLHLLREKGWEFRDASSGMVLVRKPATLLTLDDLQVSRQTDPRDSP